MTAVNAEPYEFEFDPKTTALVMIDVQRDFVDPGGFGEALGNDVSFLRRAVPPAERVLKATRARGSWSSTRSKVTALISPTARPPRKRAAVSRPASAIPGPMGRNPVAAWQAGLAWCFVIGIIILLGALGGADDPEVHAARCHAQHACGDLPSPSSRCAPAFQSWEVPWIAFISLAIIMVSWMANVSPAWQRAGRARSRHHRHSGGLDRRDGRIV